VACAAGLATLRVIQNEKLVERASSLGQTALEKLRELATRHPAIGEVRGLGLLLGLELQQEPGSAETANDRAERVMYAALRRGLNFKITMGNILTLTPTLTLTETELNTAIDILDECLTETSTAAGLHSAQ
jgi:4-aminobutyrate aminotransferase